MLHVSNVDALIIVGIFLIGILIFRNPNWFFKYNRIKITYFVLSSLLVAIFIEIRAVYFLDKWQYSEFMPLVFGIGLSPLVQLTITGLISLYIVKRLK